MSILKGDEQHEVSLLEQSRGAAAVNHSGRSAQDYVVGYVFRPDMGAVALIQKLKPAWQAGKLNGVGGKIEPGETPEHAMAREFQEEAGLYLLPERWLHFRTEQFMHTTPSKSDQFIGTRVFHFAAVCPSEVWSHIRTMEAERIVKVEFPLWAAGIGRVPGDTYDTMHALVYNMTYLIPMAATMLYQPPENRPVP